jgi:hypothetical protein
MMVASLGPSRKPYYLPAILISKQLTINIIMTQAIDLLPLKLNKYSHKIRMWSVTVLTILHADVMLKVTPDPCRFPVWSSALTTRFPLHFRS